MTAPAVDLDTFLAHLNRPGRRPLADVLADIEQMRASFPPVEQTIADLEAARRKARQWTEDQ